MLVHRRVTPSLFAGTHLYTWVKRSTVRVRCLAKEHNKMTPARARARTTRSGVERTNHEAIAPLRVMKNKLENRRKKTTVFPRVSWRIFHCTIWFIIYFPEPSTNSNEWSRLILIQFNINRPETQPFTVKNGLRDLYKWENLLGHEKKN